MARPIGPFPYHCPLTPHRPALTGDPAQDLFGHGGRPRFLIWKEATGWVVGWGAPEISDWFDPIAHALGCWHAALEVARQTRWLPARGEPSDKDYFPAGWTSAGLPVCRPVEDGPYAGACPDTVRILTGGPA